ncbi:MAG: DUF2059 domain-containing protein [Hyphomicrobiales bacterium]|nr:DUF2059 domain-containing protein [Hyphomicrobiales bacterium]
MVKFVAHLRSKKKKIALLVAASLSMMTIIGQPVDAQELSQSHMDAAKKAISVTKATVKLNDILPTAALQLAGRLISNRPDIESQISQIVNETALELAPRRGDLQKEVASIYGRIFTEEELTAISVFFATDSGQKFLKELPLVVREVEKASRVWGTGINRDLAQTVRKKLTDANLE